MGKKVLVMEEYKSLRYLFYKILEGSEWVVVSSTWPIASFLEKEVDLILIDEETDNWQYWALRLKEKNSKLKIVLMVNHIDMESMQAASAAKVKVLEKGPTPKFWESIKELAL